MGKSKAALIGRLEVKKEMGSFDIPGRFYSWAYFFLLSGEKACKSEGKKPWERSQLALEKKSTWETENCDVEVRASGLQF